MGQKVESSPTNIEELTLPACFITSGSEPVADTEQLRGHQIFNILMLYLKLYEICATNYPPTDFCAPHNQKTKHTEVGHFNIMVCDFNTRKRDYSMPILRNLAYPVSKA